MTADRPTPGPWEAVKTYHGGYSVRRVNAARNEADITDTLNDIVHMSYADALLLPKP